MTRPLTADLRARLREFYLDEIDAWQHGDKATVGRPVECPSYALEMRENVKRLEARLSELDEEAPCGRR